MNAGLNNDNPGLTALASIRRFARKRPALERCELCDADLAQDHAHLVEPASRKLLCACEACSILFSGGSQMKYRRVPRSGVRLLTDFCLTDEDWADLHLPIDLAFFMISTPAGGPIALYPSPAGATEALVPAESWKALIEANPRLRDLEPDVEALLVNRTGGAQDYFRLGIDDCYKLVGLIRTHWHGLSGGTAVWREIAIFLDGLKAKAR